MAEAALSKSLDELIKSSKATQKKAPKGGKPGAGKKGGPKPKGVALGVNKAGVGKRGQGGKPRGGRAAQPAPPRRNPDADGKWEHDMYRGGPRRGGGQAPGGGRSVFTLYISNLAFEVSDADLKELFSDYNYQKCYINYDGSGRSVGKATVVFGDRGEALKAQKRYSNMALDGLVMKLDLAEGPPAAKGGMQLSSGLMLTAARKGGRAGGNAQPGGRAFNKAFSNAAMDMEGGGAGGRGRRKPRGRGGRGGPRGGGGGGKDLDAELDNYMQE